MLILPCYARRRGLGLSVFHDRCEIVYLMVQLKVATLIHIWVDWLRAPGESSACPRGSRSTRAITLWNATQAQRDHKIIHARNFRVQPQAIMGSSIAE